MSIDRLWELFTKKINGEISGEELEELNALLRDHSGAFQMDEILAVFEELKFKRVADDQARKRSLLAIRRAIGAGDGEFAKEPAETHSGESYPGEIHPRKIYAEEANQDETYDDELYQAGGRRRNRVWWLVSLSAAAVCCILLLLPFNRQPEYGTDSVNKIHTDPGSKTTINLPDGSMVVLNAGSWLTYNKEFGVRSREIHLTGEAFFDIAKKEGMPLVVYAGTVEIRVKGTTFNVRAYPDDETIETSLLTGSIELVSSRDPERKILLRPREKIVVNKKENIPDSPAAMKEKIVPSETISLARMEPNPVDSSYAETAWLENRLVFRSETFRALARRMERRYDVHIDFIDREVSDLIFTGSFSSETLSEALDALQASVPFKYEIANQIVSISK